MQNLALESFDAFEASQPAASADFEAGFAAGQAEACAQQNVAMELARQDIGQNLADLEFTFAEAQAAVLAAFTPLMDTVMQTVLPAMSDQAFRSNILKLIGEAAKNCGAVPLQLTVHPSHFDTISDLALDLPPQIDVKADPTLGEKAGWVAAPDYERCFDLAELEQNLTQILQAIAPAQVRMTSDG